MEEACRLADVDADVDVPCGQCTYLPNAYFFRFRENHLDFLQLINERVVRNIHKATWYLDKG